jgi:hypothetical protein
MRLNSCCNPAVLSAAAPESEIRFVVGGPGFESGASRSRNLGGFVHRARFGGI